MGIGVGKIVRWASGCGLVSGGAGRVAVLLSAATARQEALARYAEGDRDGAYSALYEVSAHMMSQFPEDAGVAREARNLVANAKTLQADGLSSMDIKYMKQQMVNERRSRAGAKERIRRGE